MTRGGVWGNRTRVRRRWRNMMMETPNLRDGVHRRGFIQASGALAAGAASVTLPSVGAAAQGTMKAEEFWAGKGEVKLYLYRKRVLGEGREHMPVLFLVHASTPSSRGSFDLQVPG